MLPIHVLPWIPDPKCESCIRALEYPVFHVIPHRLGVIAQKYPVHVFIILFLSFFVQSQICFDYMKEEVKGVFALLGRFLAKYAEQING